MIEIKGPTEVHKPFSDLAIGDMFLWEGKLYLKISPKTTNNAFVIQASSQCFFYSDTEVVPVNVEMIWSYSNA